MPSGLIKQTITRDPFNDYPLKVYGELPILNNIDISKGIDLIVKISVIISTYNRADLLLLTLSSLANQSLPKDSYEVIIMDDGSTDSTKEVIISFSHRFNLIYLYREHEGYRVAQARNECIKQAKGDIIVILDSGVVVPTWFTEAHYNEHCTDSTGLITNNAVIGYVYGYDLYKDINHMPDIINFNDPDTTINALQTRKLYLDCREWLYQKYADKIYTLQTPWTLFWTANVSVNRSILSEIGCFDESFVGWGVEDIELGYRLYLKGSKFIVSRRASSIHYPHPRDNTADFQACLKNRHLFYSKYRNIELELYYSCRSSVQFNVDYKQFLFLRNHEKRSESRMNIPTEADRDIFERQFRGSKNALIGYYDKSFVKSCSPEVIMEFDEKYYEIAVRENSDKKVIHRVGIHTEFEDRYFEKIIISIPSDCLPEFFFFYIFKEAHRIAEEVFYIGNTDGIKIKEYGFQLLNGFNGKWGFYKIVINDNEGNG